MENLIKLICSSDPDDQKIALTIISNDKKLLTKELATLIYINVKFNLLQEYLNFEHVSYIMCSGDSFINSILNSTINW